MRHDVPPSARILVVDDNQGVANLLQVLLSTEGYGVELAADGREALACVAQHPPDLILLDLDLPYVDGYEVCRRLRQSPATRLTPVVIITAQGGSQSKLEAWELGADDFLTKPFHAVEVVTRCRSLLRIKRLVEERDSAEAVVFALVRAVEAKSPYTHGHSGRVQAYALALARVVGFGADDLEVLRKGALLHDIGKISVPDAILNKPGALTAAEYAIIKAHPEQGAHIVESLSSVRDAVPLIRWHHERLDGRGYPDGLMGGQIPELVRVLSVADVYDSLASERPYRAGLPLARCLEMLQTSAAEGGLDPVFVDRFCAMQKDNRAARLPRPGTVCPDAV
ncbi:MAG: response regulator [Planctomycetes bacterium]|nr:response regulator [Planctomycetota bacterium]